MEGVGFEPIYCVNHLDYAQNSITRRILSNLMVVGYTDSGLTVEERAVINMIIEGCTDLICKT